MNEVLGSILPLSMGVALGPFPIIMIVLLLGSARPNANGLAFLSGWVVGLAAIVAVLTFALDALDGAGNDPGPMAGVVRIILGSALLVMAARKFIKRFGTSDAGPLPRWMASATSYSPGRSAVMGLTLSAANPKNFAITAAAGVTIGAADLSLNAEIWAMSAYIVFASLTVLVPVAVYLIAPRKVAVPLRAVMQWLQVNHSIMTGLLLVVFGFILIGNGLGSF
ncbi:hypothetical protein ART_1976 [Arthrobacter sp. PAMC 25486]|uniref:GAP family protein n=1 Tax=Arthrobacter sp. PAMC 25486 TaxID=1494608 RepID=UPI0005359E16|nr:GAP family protein [Arthrobacter sp. PAMC 25486]AIY01575.1 hypothetical protein ART_1976 [Arthrobacter sp. PAMC 25486]